MHIRISKGDILLATNFEALPGLAKVMDREVEKLRQKLFLGLISCVVYPFVARYSRYHSAVQLTLSFYLISEFFVIAIALLFYRANLIPLKITFNNTAMAVNIKNDEIILKTAPLNLLIYSEKSNELRFNIHKVKISHGFYPLKNVYNPGGCFKLIDGNKEAFIIIHYYDAELTEKIMEMYYKS
jgi:hypothetical protein